MEGIVDPGGLGYQPMLRLDPFLPSDTLTSVRLQQRITPTSSRLTGLLGGGLLHSIFAYP